MPEIRMAARGPEGTLEVNFGYEDMEALNRDVQRIVVIIRNVERAFEECFYIRPATTTWEIATDSEPEIEDETEAEEPETDFERNVGYVAASLQGKDVSRDGDSTPPPVSPPPDETATASPLGDANICPVHGPRTQDGFFVRGEDAFCNMTVRRKLGVPILCSEKLVEAEKEPEPEEVGEPEPLEKRNFVAVGDVYRRVEGPLMTFTVERIEGDTAYGDMWTQARSFGTRPATTDLLLGPEFDLIHLGGE